MRKLLLTASALVLGMASAMAVPAKPGVKKMLTLKDGTRVEATLRGDEHVHYYQTADGRALQLAEDGYVFVNRDSLVQVHRERLSESNRLRAKRREAGARKAAYRGKRKGLVIMVEFTDVKFTYSRNTFDDFFNKTGYSDYGMAGSVHDYFLEQSYGQFDLEFDVVGPVTLTNSASYYGYDSATKTSHNDRVAAMVNAVCKEVDSQVDYSQYDWDGNGYVDQVYVIYAGYGAAQGADHTIWPHEWNVRGGVSSAYRTAEGPAIGTYGISCELMGDGERSKGKIDGVGTSCHEFSHCLGLPDFYDTSDSGTNFGMGDWDLMCSGCYNGATNGYSPSGYTAYERWFAGWLTPTELNSGCVVTDMPAIQDEPVAYVLYNDAYRNEYYLLENYQQKGFDAAGEGHGMLVLHVDYSAQAWSYNTVNSEADHQRMTIIPADNSASSGNHSGDPYPGSRRRTSLTDTGSPKASLYNENIDGEKLMHKPITSIVELNGLISFTFMGGSTLERPDALTATDVSATGFTARWGAVDTAKDYTLLVTKYIDSSQPSIIFEEEFENFVDASMNDVTKTLDDYTQIPGWSGTNLFTSANKLRVGKVRAAGELQTPVFDAPINDTTFVYLSVYNAARLGTTSLQLRLYPMAYGTLDQLKAAGYYLYLDLDDVPTISEDEPYGIVVAAAWAPQYGGMCIAVVPDAADSGVYMDYLAATDGRYDDDEQAAPARRIAARAAKARRAMPVMQWRNQPYLAASPMAKAPRRVPREETEIYTSATNSYVFTDLEPAYYTYMVRANGENGLVSPWSEPFTVDLTTGIEAVRETHTAAPDGLFYDLTGRRIAQPRRGLYIHDGRKYVK